MGWKFPVILHSPGRVFFGANLQVLECVMFSGKR